MAANEALRFSCVASFEAAHFLFSLKVRGENKKKERIREMDETSYFIGVFVVAIICGMISKGIASSRGMEGGFWWGFFLSVIGIIVVAVRPNDGPKPSTKSSNVTHVLYCNKCNLIYTSGENCGNCNSPLFETTILLSDWMKYSADKKRELKEAFSKGQYYFDRNRHLEKSASTTTVASSGADEIRKYKELLDGGIITQEEFDAKKKQLLGL